MMDCIGACFTCMALDRESSVPNIWVMVDEHLVQLVSPMQFVINSTQASVRILPVLSDLDNSMQLTLAEEQLALAIRRLFPVAGSTFSPCPHSEISFAHRCLQHFEFRASLSVQLLRVVSKSEIYCQECAPLLLYFLLQIQATRVSQQLVQEYMSAKSTWVGSIILIQVRRYVIKLTMDTESAWQAVRSLKVPLPNRQGCSCLYRLYQVVDLAVVFAYRRQQVPLVNILVRVGHCWFRVEDMPVKLYSTIVQSMSSTISSTHNRFVIFMIRVCLTWHDTSTSNRKEKEAWRPRAMYILKTIRADWLLLMQDCQSIERASELLATLASMRNSVTFLAKELLL